MTAPHITAGRLLSKLIDAWPIVTSVAVATWILSAQVSHFQARIDKIASDQALFADAFQQRLKELHDSQYTIAQACEQAFRFCMDNQGVVVRDPRDLNKVISMQRGTALPRLGNGDGE